MLESASNSRLPLLDILRGFSLIGILFPNIFAVADIPLFSSMEGPIWQVHQLVFKGRFFTIFALVFGVSFFMFARNAESKGLSVGKVAMRRLLWLLVLGIPHFMIHPGEALVPFTVFGLFLIPQYYFSPYLILGLGLIGVVIGLFTTSLFITPGLICLGLFLGKIRYFENPTRFRNRTWIVWLIALISMGPFLYLQIQNPSYSGQIYLSLAGIAISTFCVTSITLSSVLAKLLTPLAASGRMALTVYIAQTIVVIIIDRIHPLNETEVCKVWLAIWPVQVLLSILWMRFFRTGPLEWFWRWATYNKRPAWLRNHPLNQ